MKDEDLRSELKQLHDQLTTSLHKEPEEKDVLSHIMTDLVLVAQGEELDGVDSESLKEQLEEKATNFESRHPKAAGVLREVMDVLARLGI